MELWIKIFLILAGMGNLFLAFFILSKGRGSRIHITFSVFLFASVLWIAAIYLALTFGIENPSPFLARIFGMLTFAFGSITLSSFLAFTDIFPMPSNPEGVRTRAVIYYGLGILAFGLSISPYLQKGVETVDGVLTPVFGWGLAVWGIYMVSTTAYGLYKLISKYFRLGPGYEKTQLRYTFLGLALVGIAAFFVNLLIFVLNGKSLASASVGPGSTFFMVVLITYAIARHRLMDLGVVFRNTLIYTIVIAILGGINLLLFLLLNEYLELPAWVAIGLSSTVVVLTLVPIRDRVQELCYKYIFQMRQHAEIIAEISEDLTRILDLDGLRRIVVDKVVHILHLQGGSMFISDRTGGGYTSIYATLNGKPDFAGSNIHEDSILVHTLRSTGKMLLLTDLKRTLPDEDYKPYQDQFTEIKSAALLPLMIKGDLIGIISLGPKRSGDIYSYEDINMLTFLGNQMAASLENSRLFDEILAMKNHYSAILQHLRNGVITMDSNQNINTINQRAKNILNLGDEDLISSPVGVLGPVLSTIMINRQTTPLDFYGDEIELNVRGRGQVPLGIICTVMRDEKEPPGVLMVIDDLTVEKQLQERIRRTDRLASIGTLAAGMAHEIKNPLVSIKTFSQLLPEKFDDSDFRNQFSSITSQEVERINHIVEQLLNFARPMKPRPEKIDLHRIINEVIAVLDEDAKKKSTTITSSYTDEPAMVMVDPNQMKQVFLNLMMNSLDALGTGGKIDVATDFILEGVPATTTDEQVQPSIEDEMTKRKLRVRITDNGKGVPKDMLQNLFDPFFTTRSEGFGLGLAIVHGIIVEHNASIEIDSEEGEWTCVTIKIPARRDL